MPKKTSIQNAALLERIQYLEKENETLRGGSAKVKTKTTRKFNTRDIAISMISYVGDRGAEGSTYYDWWKWFSTTYGKDDPHAAIQYRGTGTARWYELQNTGVLINAKNSDGTNKRRKNLEDSVQTAEVFVVRKGATVLDWSRGDKKGKKVRDDETTVIKAYRTVRKQWHTASKSAREKLLLTLLSTISKQFKMVPVDEPMVAPN